MSLPLAPPPGLPLPTYTAAEKAEWIKQLQEMPSFPWVPAIALFLVSVFLIFKLWQHLKPIKKTKISWQEEVIDPFIGQPSAPLTTTEIVTKVFAKDQHLAEKLEPILQEMDLERFSGKERHLEPLIEKTRVLFIQKPE